MRPHLPNPRKPKTIRSTYQNLRRSKRARVPFHRVHRPTIRLRKAHPQRRQLRQHMPRQPQPQASTRTKAPTRYRTRQQQVQSTIPNHVRTKRHTRHLNTKANMHTPLPLLYKQTLPTRKHRRPQRHSSTTRKTRSRKYKGVAFRGGRRPLPVHKEERRPRQSSALVHFPVHSCKCIRKCPRKRIRERPRKCIRKRPRKSTRRVRNGRTEQVMCAVQTHLLPHPTTLRRRPRYQELGRRRCARKKGQ